MKLGKVSAALTFFVSLFCLSSNAFAVDAKEWATAINVAGKQRMLSQKMSKEFFLAAAGVEAESNRKSLKRTMALFDRALSQLLDGDADLNIPAAPNAEIKAQLEKVQGLWTPFRTLLTVEMSKTSVPSDVLVKIAADNMPILKNMHAAVGMYEKASGNSGGKMKDLGKQVNVAGRQRMLSQKMSKEIAQIALGVNTDQSKTDLQGTKSLFEKSHAGLKNGDAEIGIAAVSSPAVKRQLGVVETTWGKFKPLVETALTGGTVENSLLEQVASLNPKLLKEANQTVVLLERSA